MLIFPAIDLYGGKAVRLLRGDYDNMTVYSENPPSVAADFKAAGAKCIHLVDLEGAKEGSTPNLHVVEKIVGQTGLFAEIGGGIRSMETIEKYLSIGVGRVILGTAAVEDEAFLRRAAEKYGDKIAVGADIKDGFIAVRGWTEKSDKDAFSFCRHMENLGIRTLICTDISKDGAMQGTNRELYRDLAKEFKMQIVASGGVSSIDDIRHLRSLDLYGAIIGKAYYTGAINLKEALEAAK
ncbi:MAG: 1-(5-phosphoribosyl)-5-[Clostridia bacterium]|nr:1-(5-phosphoribosyl)-5-[(5-phosphoribosylamino)methylideneamino]imidazole-4-carboxamide isomerase [Clostridia bacterium]